MKKRIIIAIDGPAGAGKSTVSKLVAQKLKLLYIDSGAMYRALTVGVINKGIKPTDSKAIVSLAKKCRIGLKTGSGKKFKVTLNNVDITEKLRSKEVNTYVSDVAKIKEVRSILTEAQRKLAKKGGAVIEGRDIGTVVFPDAHFKFFLDASIEERARRRYKEIKGKIKMSLREVRENVRKRDKIDSSRKVAPLRKANDAIYIDTTKMGIKEVVNLILGYIRNGTKKDKESELLKERLLEEPFCSSCCVY
jgi:cytidylate kinase